MHKCDDPNTGCFCHPERCVCPACRLMTVKTPAQRAEEALREAHEAALYWVDDTKECVCDKCCGKRAPVIRAISRAVLAARLEQADKDLKSASAMLHDKVSMLVVLEDERNRLRRELDAMDKEGADGR